jgi:hypothetical protein
VRVFTLIRRLVVGFFLANFFFALSMALTAAVTRRRLESEPPPEPGDNDLEVSAIFDGVEFHSEALALRSVRGMAWFGGLQLDLREARPDPMGAQLRLGSLYGGLDVVIPDEWPVVVRKIGIFGGVEEPGEPVLTDAGTVPEVEISAMALFGGLSIRRASLARLERAIEMEEKLAQAEPSGGGGAAG